MCTTVSDFKNSPKEAALSKLVEKPDYSWPSIGLFIYIMISFSCSTVLAINNSIPIFVAILINALACYIAYTILHESAHGLISKNKYINNATGTLSLLFITPMPFFSTYRFLHMTHHRFVNVPEKDPDYFCGAGPNWSLPFRWMLMDIAYVMNYFTMGFYSTRPKKEKIEFWVATTFGVCLLSYLFTMGYFYQFFLLYFIPTRIALFFLAIMFDYLPHYPHKVTVQEDKYKATNNRIGLEWLLSPLFLGQNYHLSHHIYPNVPFYRYRKIWECRKEFHNANHAAEVKYYKLTSE